MEYFGSDESAKGNAVAVKTLKCAVLQLKKTAKSVDFANHSSMRRHHWPRLFALPPPLVLYVITL
jgi:hypothetical protein